MYPVFFGKAKITGQTINLYLVNQLTEADQGEIKLGCHIDKFLHRISQYLELCTQQTLAVKRRQFLF